MKNSNLSMLGCCVAAGENDEFLRRLTVNKDIVLSYFYNYYSNKNKNNTIQFYHYFLFYKTCKFDELNNKILRNIHLWRIPSTTAFYKICKSYINNKPWYGYSLRCFLIDLNVKELEGISSSDGFNKTSFDNINNELHEIVKYLDNPENPVLSYFTNLGSANVSEQNLIRFCFFVLPSDAAKVERDLHLLTTYYKPFRKYTDGKDIMELNDNESDSLKMDPLLSPNYRWQTVNVDLLSPYAVAQIILPSKWFSQLNTSPSSVRADDIKNSKEITPKKWYKSNFFIDAMIVALILGAGTIKYLIDKPNNNDESKNTTNVTEYDNKQIHYTDYGDKLPELLDSFNRVYSQNPNSFVIQKIGWEKPDTIILGVNNNWYSVSKEQKKAAVESALKIWLGMAGARGINVNVDEIEVKVIEPSTGKKIAKWGSVLGTQISDG